MAANDQLYWVAANVSPIQTIFPSAGPFILVLRIPFLHDLVFVIAILSHAIWLEPKSSNIVSFDICTTRATMLPTGIARQDLVW